MKDESTVKLPNSIFPVSTLLLKEDEGTNGLDMASRPVSSIRTCPVRLSHLMQKRGRPGSDRKYSKMNWICPDPTSLSSFLGNGVNTSKTELGSFTVPMAWTGLDMSGQGPGQATPIF